MSKEIVLALGGGGVKGIAHLGVVQCLLDNDYEIGGIAGTSAGGMFGAPLAALVPPTEILQVVANFFKNPDFHRTASDSPSLMGTGGVESALSPFIKDRLIENLPIKFCATAVSLKTGEEVVFSEGDVMAAVLATIAIPGVFPARGDDVLVDGGVLDPVPVLPARALNPILPIVAVTLHSKPADFSPLSLTPISPDNIPEKIVDHLSKNRIVESLKNMNVGIEIGSDRLTELNLLVTKPDVIVRPLVGQFGSLQKVDPQVLYDEGYRAMQEQLPELDDALSFVRSVARITKYRTADPEQGD